MIGEKCGKLPYLGKLLMAKFAFVQSALCNPLITVTTCLRAAIIGGMQKNVHRVPCAATGFTMIELVVVMAIVAILALMAMPLFTGKSARNQILESAALSDIAKGKVADYYTNTKYAGTLPANNTVAGLPAPDKMISSYVSAVTVVDGAVNVTFGNNANSRIAGKRLTWRPIVVKDTPTTPMDWICAGTPVPKGMDAGGTNVTDIPPDALPPNCR